MRLLRRAPGCEPGCACAPRSSRSPRLHGVSGQRGADWRSSTSSAPSTSPRSQRGPTGRVMSRARRHRATACCTPRPKDAEHPSATSEGRPRDQCRAPTGGRSLCFRAGVSAELVETSLSGPPGASAAPTLRHRGHSGLPSDWPPHRLPLHSPVRIVLAGPSFRDRSTPLLEGGQAPVVILSRSECNHCLRDLSLCVETWSLAVRGQVNAVLDGTSRWCPLRVVSNSSRPWPTRRGRGW